MSHSLVALVALAGLLLAVPAEIAVAHLCPTTPAHPRWRRAFLAVGIFAAFGLMAAELGSSGEVYPGLLGIMGMFSLAAADFTCGRIPNRIVYPTIAACILAMVGTSGADGSWVRLGSAMAAGALCCALLGVVHLASPEGMGMGDVRLGALVGLMAGWVAPWFIAALIALLVGFAAGSIAGVATAFVRRTGRRTQIRFGPYLVLGALVVMFWRPQAI